MMFPDESIYHTEDLYLEKTAAWTSPETGKEYGHGLEGHREQA